MKGSIQLAGPVLILALAACFEDLSRAPMAPPLAPSLAAAGGGIAGNVYTMTNAASGKTISARATSCRSKASSRTSPFTGVK